MLQFSKLQPINIIFTNYAKSSPLCNLFWGFVSVSCICLAFKERALMGVLTAQEATSWRSGDACRAVVSATTLTPLQKMDTNPAKSKWIPLPPFKLQCLATGFLIWLPSLTIWNIQLLMKNKVQTFIYGHQHSAALNPTDFCVCASGAL